MSVNQILIRIIKLIISSVVFLCDEVKYYFRKSVGVIQAPRVVVLYYHSVPDDMRESFEKQMVLISSIAHPISTDDISTKIHKKNCVNITFDDAFASVVKNALPSLDRYRIPFTVFVPTGYFNQKPLWIKDPNNSYLLERILSVEEIAALDKNEIVTIGSHTIHHYKLTDISDELVFEEMKSSKEVLEELLGHAVNYFCFPHGKNNRFHHELAKRAGYTKVFTIEPHVAEKTKNEFVTGRVGVDLTDSHLELCLKVKGAYRWLPVAFGLKKKILKKNLK